MGLKENQKQMKKQVSLASEQQPFLIKLGTAEKGHGRIEVREYEFYDVLEMKKCERWNDCQIRTAVKVKRERIELKSGKKSQEESYYVSNLVGDYEELAEAIRKHWAVETNNHVRDVSLQEDKMRSKKRSYNKLWQV